MSTFRPILRSLRGTSPLRQTAQPRPTTRPTFTPNRRLNTRPSPSGHSSGGKRRYLPYALLPAGLLLLPAATLACDPDPSTLPPPSSLSSASTFQLFKAWFVWTLICTPGMVDYSPAILDFFFKTPLKAPVEWFVRNSFFEQFVPGESVAECMPALHAMRERNVGAMLNYSAEVDESQLKGSGPDRDAQDRAEREKKLGQILLALDVAGEYERSLPIEQRGVTGFALKITGLVDCNILERASYSLLRLRPLTKSNSATSPNSATFVPYPGTPQSADAQIVARSSMAGERGLGKGLELLALGGKLDEMGVLESDHGLREGDMEELNELWGKLKIIGNKAKENNVNLFVDAEHTWYQPALDAYTLLLSQEFNRPPVKKDDTWTGPLIFGTYQSYLTRQPSHLIHALAHADAHGYALGIKLVRGAYFMQERQKWLDEGRHGADPIWPNKPATDMAYDGSIATIMTTMKEQLDSQHPERALSVVFGTHNSESCDLVCDGLVKNGLAFADPISHMLHLRPDVRGKIRVAQLYGMKDDLTDRMSTRFVNDGKPVALKYIAYGKLDEVMPYLGRRAIENKSLMSGDHGSGAERKRVGAELRKRIFG
ncbi:hypothetical protein B9479_006608 [Cryptococcus floricola]|uniref:Proline dehydrogenase n=1 Tax=Cryptococcus floricola TaxID=2591691 RepID=A0A5D3AQ44_9TREE|nr:hypothetical protein B9479_006608 [Cryptococcus floricola]